MFVVCKASGFSSTSRLKVEIINSESLLFPKLNRRLPRPLPLTTSVAARATVSRMKVLSHVAYNDRPVSITPADIQALGVEVWWCAALKDLKRACWEAQISLKPSHLRTGKLNPLSLSLSCKGGTKAMFLGGGGGGLSSERRMYAVHVCVCVCGGRRCSETN